MRQNFKQFCPCKYKKFVYYSVSEMNNSRLSTIGFFLTLCLSFGSLPILETKKVYLVCDKGIGKAF